MSESLLNVPPGRTGRLWLRRRLDTASRASALLDRKLRLLLGEQDRLRAEQRQTREEWESACAQVDQWLLRASLLHGRQAVALAAAPSAEVTVSYSTAVGTRYPSGATCVTSRPDRMTAPAVAATAAGARHAAAARAVQVVDAEVGATRYRLRAIESRWMPRLERALAQVELGLEELEHADGVRLRQVLARPGSQPAGASRRPDGGRETPCGRATVTAPAARSRQGPCARVT